MKTFFNYANILLSLLICLSGCCTNKERDPADSARLLIADYGSYPFEDWNNWGVSYREGAGYYLACYHREDSLYKILFMKEDTIKVLSHLSPEGTRRYMSLNELKRSGDWERFYPEADYRAFCQLALFITNHQLLSVSISDDLVYIKGSDFDIIKQLKDSALIDDSYYLPLIDDWFVWIGY